MKKRVRVERYLVLTWRNSPNDPTWKLSHATIAHSLGKAKALRTRNTRYWNLRTSIIAEAILDGVGELSEPVSRNDFRKKALSDRLADIPVRTARQ